MKVAAATAIAAGVIAAAAFAIRAPMLGIGRRREAPPEPSEPTRDGEAEK